VDPLRPSDDPATAVAQLSDWLVADRPQTLLIETSGSTGQPKRVLISRDAVLASVRASAARLGASGQWVLALPSSYVAGVQVIVRSLVAGHPPLLGSPVEVRRRSRETREADDTPLFTSLVPTQLHRLLADRDAVDALRQFHTILLGGGPVGGLRERAAAHGIRVVATYGASETAGGCVYDGLPLDGVAVKLDVDGRIRLGGPTIFDGYDGDPELTAATLVDGWYVTSDAGRLDEDGHLQVLGRLDDVALSGGVNVPLPAVAARLREHPDIDQAEVLAVDDDEWGQRVVAFVVAPGFAARSARTSTGVGRLRDWVAEAHPRSWAPRQVVVLDEYPLLPNGKVDREALRRLA
jgi:O-succinylbenzoic acid--CoA ligase